MEDEPITTETVGHKQVASKSSRSSLINKSILVGRLVATPTRKATTNATPVRTARVATNDRGEAEFHNLVLWRRQAEFAAQWMTKGRLVTTKAGSRAVVDRRRLPPSLAPSRPSPIPSSPSRDGNRTTPSEPQGLGPGIVPGPVPVAAQQRTVRRAPYFGPRLLNVSPSRHNVSCDR